MMGFAWFIRPAAVLYTSHREYGSMRIENMNDWNMAIDKNVHEAREKKLEKVKHRIREDSAKNGVDETDKLLH